MNDLMTIFTFTVTVIFFIFITIAGYDAAANDDYLKAIYDLSRFVVAAIFVFHIPKYFRRLNNEDQKEVDRQNRRSVLLL